MIYRAESLYSAMSHAEKIFEMVSQIIFDKEIIKQIIKEKSITKENQVFAKHHEIIIRRLSTQINSFLDSYKLFKVEFIFNGAPLMNFVDTELEIALKCLQGMAREKRKNPRLAE